MGNTWIAFSVKYTGAPSSGESTWPGPEHKTSEGLGDLMTCDWPGFTELGITLRPHSASTYLTSLGKGQLLEQCKVITYKESLSKCKT